MSSFLVFLLDEKEWGVGVAAPKISIDDGIRKCLVSGTKWSDGSGNVKDFRQLKSEVSEINGVWTRVKNSAGVEKCNYQTLKHFLLMNTDGQSVVPVTISTEGNKIIKITP